MGTKKSKSQKPTSKERVFRRKGMGGRLVGSVVGRKEKKNWKSYGGHCPPCLRDRGEKKMMKSGDVEPLDVGGMGGR